MSVPTTTEWEGAAASWPSPSTTATTSGTSDPFATIATTADGGDTRARGSSRTAPSGQPSVTLSSAAGHEIVLTGDDLLLGLLLVSLGVQLVRWYDG